ncbi:hypothetical protein BDZ94DRAFT_1256626 [Collybia nuda]|uniref:Secreted protein n=1 Tax=Collybia nuda TaxID=64659 RepID=A0A9P5YAP4_9AGAR|nr:hypothetical protein BDZ94DRAFT_1256626 [Collybia nuda]
MTWSLITVIRMLTVLCNTMVAYSLNGCSPSAMILSRAWSEQMCLMAGLDVDGALFVIDNGPDTSVASTLTLL